MTPRTLTRIPPRGRRAIIIRTAMSGETSLSDIVRYVRAVEVLKIADPALDRLKTKEAVRDLRRAGILVRTPNGYRATPAGVELLRVSQPGHG